MYASRFRGSLTLLAALFVVMFVGAALTGGFYASAEEGAAAPGLSPEEALVQTAAVARNGLELALVTAAPPMLAALVEGADTIILRGDGHSMHGAEGSFVVRASRAGEGRVQLASTAVLADAPQGRCTASVSWALDGMRPPPPAAAAAACIPDPGGGSP